MDHQPKEQAKDKEQGKEKEKMKMKSDAADKLAKTKKSVEPARNAGAASKAVSKPNKEAGKKTDKGTGANGNKLALILIRGFIRTREDIVKTLFTLRLRKKNVCVVIPDTPSLRSAAVKCKDYITYGEIDDETYRLLVEKRGKKARDGSLRKFFSLHPPKGGFERKGIKTPFGNKGALGYRGAKINELIRKML